MENPAHWNQVQKDIAEAMHEFHTRTFTCGPDLVTSIYNKLRAKGHLKDEQETPREPDKS